MIKSFDCSNYTSQLTSTNLQAALADGFSHAIVQSIDPPAGYPPGVTRQQIIACLNAGLTVDAYLWLWMDLDVNDIHRKLDLLSGLGVRQLWLDVEDLAANKYTQAQCEAKVIDALQVCDSWAINNNLPQQFTGIYSGKWYWSDPRYMGNSTTFSNRELWDANYDNVPDANLGFSPYGGWNSARIKQYKGTTQLGEISGVDLNVLSLAEEEEIDPNNPNPTPPPPVPCAEFINGIAYMADDIGDALLTECKRPSVRKAIVRAHVKEMQRVRTQLVGPRP